METNPQDNNFIFSKAVKAGKRIYYFDVKKSKNNDNLYLSITESLKCIDATESGSSQVTFAKQRLMIYKEDFEKFANAFTECIDFINNVAESEAEDNTEDNSFKVNFDDISFDI